MLVAEGEFALAAAPGVRFFPDDGAAQAFYAVAELPRLALADDGQPEINLTVFGTRVAGAFAPNGGVLTLTTVLDITDEQRAQLPRLLAQRLAEAGVEEPRPQLLSPQWIDAAVDVHLGEGVDLVAAPSLSGANASSFNVKLTAAQAKTVISGWHERLPGAVIRYRGRLRAAAGGSAAAVHSSSTTTAGPGGAQSWSVLGFSISQSEGGGDVEVVAAGPLVPDAADVESRLQIVEL